MPLREAVVHDRLKLLERLVQAGPNQDALDDALQSASHFRRVEMVELLLDAGARVMFDPTTQWGAGGEPPGSPAREAIQRMLLAHRSAQAIASAMGGGAGEHASRVSTDLSPL